MPVKSNFAKVSKDLARKVGAEPEVAMEIARETMGTLMSNVIIGGPYSPGTPKKSGAAAYSWTVCLDDQQPKRFTTRPPDSGGLGGLIEALARISRWTMKQRIQMGTNAPYMDRLEFEGWSQQAPSGFVRQAVAQFSTMWREAARRVNGRGGRIARRDGLSSRVGR